MQWIKIPLVLAAVGVLVFLFRHRGRVEMRAGVRVLAMLLFAAAVASIVVPGIPQAAAEAVGVRRGTDLLLYVLVVVYVLTTLGLYFRVREGDQRLRRLVRDIALERAERDAPWAPVPGPDGPRPAPQPGAGPGAQDGRPDASPGENRA